MPRTAAQNEVIKDKRRKKLIVASLKVFAFKGLDKATIDDITAASDSSHGLFYHYFDSKEEVFDALLKEVISDRTELVVFDKAKKAGGVAGLEIICNSIPKVFKKESGVNTLCIGKILYDFHNQYEAPCLKPYKNGPFDSLGTILSLIKEGQQTGDVISGDPTEIALAFCDSVCGAINRALRFRRPHKKNASSDIYLEMLLKRPL